MNEAKLKTILESVCEDCKISEFSSDGKEQFRCTVYCKLPGNEYDDKCAALVEKISTETNTSWVTYKRLGKLKRDVFRKIFKCQHTSFNKKKGERKYTNRIRGRGCTAKIDIKFKKLSRDTLKNDVNLKTRLNCIVLIDFKHNHSVLVVEAFGILRCTKETVKTFCSYFESGMTPSASKNFHEIKLIENSEGEDEILKALANAQLNPTLRQVIYMFENWRKEKYGERNQESVVECLMKKKEILKETGSYLIICEDLTVVVLTPVMKRVFALEDASDMLFIDSSGSCDQTNTCATFVFCATKVGALPLACILHTSLAEECYSKCFKLLKDALELNGNKQFNPSVIMTDDSDTERSALKNVFPEATLLLCTFHVCQALWRWLWDKDHEIDKVDHPNIMGRFQQLLYADTTTSASDNYNELIHSVEARYPNAKKHFESLWKRRSEWCFAYREGVITRGNNTNNYCEASICIFKDIVLQRCKAFNCCALVDFICEVFENYHKRRLIDFANSRRDQKFQSHYAKFLKKADPNEIIMQRNEYEFKVNSLCHTDVYTVNTKLETCDCMHGRGGRYCKHMCAVELKFNIQMSIRPLLTVAEKVQFAQVALGSSVSADFYKGMDISDDTQEEIRRIPSFHEPMECETAGETYRPTLRGTERNDVVAACHSLRTELNRIVDIIETQPTSVSVDVIQNTARKIKNIKTPSQVLHFLREKLMVMKTKNIRVQPTSISRRKNRGISKGARRVQSGHPTKNEAQKSRIRKRKHNLALSVKNVCPNAKLH